MRRSSLLLLTSSLLLSTTPASGQWVVELSAGGTEHDAVSADVGTRSAILGVRHDGGPWFYLSAGVPLDSEGLPWAAAGLGGRLRQRLATGLELGVDASGQAHGYRSPYLGASGGGVVLEGLPFVALTAGPARVEARSGVLQYTRAFNGVDTSRTVHDNGVLAMLELDPRLLLTGEARLVRAEEGDYPFFGGSLELALGTGGLWAYAGRWTSDLIDTPVWGVGGAIPLGERTALNASYVQDTNDPLYWNEPRRLWRIGLSSTLGPRERVADIIAPIAPEAGGGRVVFRIAADDSEAPPSVAGDFNEWTPVPMRRVGDEWVVSLPIAPGVYQYAFQRPDGTWFVPASIPNRVDDGFGGTNAVLVVPATGG